MPEKLKKILEEVESGKYKTLPELIEFLNESVKKIANEKNVSNEQAQENFTIIKPLDKAITNLSKDKEPETPDPNEKRVTHLRHVLH